MEWSPQQAAALDDVGTWHSQCLIELRAGQKLSRPVFYLAGYAGTGKSTLTKHIASQIDGKTVYAAYTGKAAMVMRKSGCDGALTIHSAMYEAKQDEDSGEVSFDFNKEGPFSRAALIAIDECSMVDAPMAEEILSYGRPVLVMGDPAQLPPVTSDRDRENGTGAGYFTSRTPDVMLTEIHRQAAGNPIIQLASDVREGRPLRIGLYGESRVISKSDITAAMVMAVDQVLVGKNDTRGAYNARIRELLGRSNFLPCPGDRLVCIKNDRKTAIFNGGIFRVGKVNPMKKGRAANGEIVMILDNVDQPERDPIKVWVRHECFNGKLAGLPWQARKGLQEFDYGYALTVHKAQGSQWDDVLLLDQSATFKADNRRWLYTGLTRAAERITVAI
ncbi:ATP-dependent RecD-like DNA helicase [Cypionkella sp.]|uniref:ATP-dependent DNA helicase n=1 Tax=Cypionkella sp. TaxID=2811411 RepID=UPI00271FF82B|nr:AAA family ATPase [Cypionkella sp.]MDO8986083.1 AAA family ATPase [Cypionkella sp.]